MPGSIDYMAGRWYWRGGSDDSSSCQGVTDPDGFHPVLTLEKKPDPDSTLEKKKENAFF